MSQRINKDIKPGETPRNPVARIEIKKPEAPVVRKPEPQPDQAKSRQMAKLPTDLGRKLAEQRVLYQPQRQGARMKFQSQLSPEMRGRLTTAYQRMVKDSFVRQLRGSQVSEFIEHRFSEMSRGEQNLRRMPATILARLFSLRHQLKESGGDLRLALRYELHRLKEERQQSKERLSSVEDQKQEAAQGKEGSERAEDQKAREGFLKRNSHVIQNLNVDDSESAFEALLKKVLKGSSAAPELKAGQKASFKGKSEEDWLLFFKNVLAQGSLESSSKQKSENILEAFYRGVFKNLSSQDGAMTLVTDLKLAAGDKELHEKFVRIMIDNPELLKKISALNPGDDLPPELLALLGDTVEYTKVVNKADILAAQTGELLLQQLRQNMNPSVTSRLEQQLIKERRDKAQEAQKRGDGGESHQPAFYLGRDFEDKKELRPGRAKLGLFLAYTLASCVMTLILYILFRSSF